MAKVYIQNKEIDQELFAAIAGEESSFVGDQCEAICNHIDRIAVEKGAIFRHVAFVDDDSLLCRSDRGEIMLVEDENFLLPASIDPFEHFAKRCKEVIKCAFENDMLSVENDETAFSDVVWYFHPSQS